MSKKVRQTAATRSTLPFQPLRETISVSRLLGVTVPGLKYGWPAFEMPRMGAETAVARQAASPPENWQAPFRCAIDTKQAQSKLKKLEHAGTENCAQQLTPGQDNRRLAPGQRCKIFSLAPAPVKAWIR